MKPVRELLIYVVIYGQVLHHFVLIGHSIWQPLGWYVKKTRHPFKRNYVRMAYDSPENRYIISFLSNIYHLNMIKYANKFLIRSVT